MASLQQSSFVFFLLPITFFFLASPAMCKSKSKTLIEEICRDKNVEDYEFCQNTFNHHLTCPSADIHGLLKFTIRHTFNTANFVYSNIVNLLQYTTDRSTKKHLQECVAGYNTVILQFSLAPLLVEKHEYKDAFDVVRETVPALKKCKIDIKIPRHPKSPVIKANENTKTLIAMTLSSLELLL